MSDILLAAAVLGVLYLVVKRTAPAPQVLTQTPSPSPPSLPQIAPGPVIIGDSYGVPPFTVNNAPGPVSPAGVPGSVAYPVPPPPPPSVSGGIAGGVGTGGLPLGSTLTPGVSTGTGTNAAVDIFGRAYVVNGIAQPGFDIWGRPLAN